MKPILYEYNESQFMTNGLGRLSEAILCHVEEERNGKYELTMVYPVTGLHYSDLKEGRLIYAFHDETADKQPFRIYHISRPTNGKVTLNAHHITYDLSKITIMPCSGTSAADALSAIENNTVVPCDFEFWTDSAVSANWSVDVPSSVRSILGGSRGSILDVYGGEYEWDGMTVKLHSARGQDTDVVISYGKNLTSIKYDTDDSDVWTGIIPFWRGDDGNGTEVTVSLTEKVIYSPHRLVFAKDSFVPKDFSGDFEEMPTEAQLRSRATSYVNANAKAAVPASIDVSFIELWQTEEYKAFAPLERLRLCDKVTIRHKELGIESTAKIVKTKYDVLKEKYFSMTVGDVRTNLMSNLQNSVEDMLAEESAKTATKSYTKRAIDHATDLLRGGLGGNVVLGVDGNGKPNELMFMDTVDISTAVKVLRINMNGIGFSSNGYDGPFTSAWTLDGHFNADFITTGTMLADRIKGGTLELGGSLNGVGGDGVLKVYNASGTQIGKWDKDGISVKNGTINGPSIIVGGSNNTSGTLQVNNASGTSIITMDNTGLTVKKGTINGPSIIVGGSNNTSGTLRVNNAAGTAIVTLDNTGLTVNKGTINGPNIVVGGSNNANGILEVKNSSGTTVVTLNNEGAVTKSGNNWSVFNGGYLKGGTDLYSSSTESGYISFNQHHANSNGYGTRIAGREMLALLSPVIAFGAYAGATSTVTAYAGQSKTITYVTSLNTPTVSMQTQQVWVDDIDWFMLPTSVQVGVTGNTDQIAFTKGLMTTA